MNINAKIFHKIQTNGIYHSPQRVLHLNQPSGVCSWNAKMVQQVRTDQWNASHDQDEGENKHMIILIDAEKNWQNSTFIPKEKYSANKKRRKLLQHDQAVYK